MSQTLTSFTFNPQQQYLFKRAYAIAIGAPNQTAALQYANFPVPGKNGTIQPPSPLRIKFDIQKTMEGTSGKAKVEIYNLSVDSRQSIKKGYIINLKAGYNGLIGGLFLGNVLPQNLKSDRKEADIVTTLECGDGESAIQMATFSPAQAYPAGTTLATILTDVANKMNIPTTSNPVGVDAGTAVGIPNVTYGRGISIEGFCKDILDTLLKPVGLRWSIQNGSLDIIPVGAYNGQTAIVVASGVTANPGKPSVFDPAKATGLIGVPSNNGQYLEFISLLNPKIVPGALVQMISENTALNGFYKVNSAHYEGDTHDTKWQVSCQCIAMPNIVQNLPVAEGSKYNTAVIA